MDKRKICDSHTHSSNSFDAKNTVEELCESAIGLGLYALTITDHCEANIYDDPQHSEFGDFSKRIPQSVKDIAQAKRNTRESSGFTAGWSLGSRCRTYRPPGVP